MQKPLPAAPFCGIYNVKGCDRMGKFVSKEKLSKKAMKLAAAEKRSVWAFSPVTRRIESKKTYDRKRLSRAGYDDGMGEFIFISL